MTQKHIRPSAFPLTKNLPKKAFDTVGAERVQGKEIAMSVHGESAGIFLNSEESGDYQTNITFRPSSHRTFFIRGENLGEKKIHLNIHVKKKAQITFVLGIHNVKHLDITGEVYLEEGANIKILSICKNEGLANFVFRSHQKGKNAVSHISVLNIGVQNGKTDITAQNIGEASYTEGKIVMNSILLGNSYIRIQGVPTVNLKAENCISHLSQKTLLLSEKARIVAIPMLAIANNKVEASHKSSLMQLSEEDLFYLQSRGIDEHDSRKLFLEGILAETIDQISDEPLRNEIDQKTESVLAKYKL